MHCRFSAVPMRLGHAVLALSVLLLALAPANGDIRPSQSAVADVDSDGDGLSDFQEIHKYCTDPHRKSTAGRGVPDGDSQERRQFTYSIRTIVRVLRPVNIAALNDDYQDARVLRETKDFVELEVISYPLNTNAAAITANPNWKKDYAGMQEYLRPGITTNWDEGMRQELLKELAKDGIDTDQLTDKQVVEKVSAWVLRRCAYKTMFDTMFVDYAGGKPAIFPGLEQAFEKEKGDRQWTVQEQFAHELLGKEMFTCRARGSCTSSAVLLCTVLRALGIPTRMIMTIPIVDANDPSQVEMVRNNIHHHQVRATIHDGLLRLGHGFTNHAYNEVYVGNRWRRLNYQYLGQNILDSRFFGLMIHVHTFNDLSEAELTPTWGRRYALGLRDAEFKTSNPYSTLEISDCFGRDSKIANPPAEEKEHKILTVTRAYWLGSKECPEIIRQRGRAPHTGEAHFYIHPDESYPDQDHLQYKKFMMAADKNFLLQAPGQPDVRAQMEVSFFTGDSLREILVVIPPDEFVKMKSGVAYTIHPVNSVPERQWKVKHGLTISREPSLEEKVENLQQRLDRLEKQMTEILKKTPK